MSMGTGLFDIQDRAEVLHPNEIEAGKAQCIAENIHYVERLNGRPLPLTTFVERLTKRWQRATETHRMIEAMRAGYCTVEPRGAAPASDARH